MNTDLREGQGAERRVEPRVPLARSVWYRLLRPRAGEAEAAEGMAFSYDLSYSGCGLSVTRPLRVHDQALLEIALAETSVSAVGRVVHIQEQAPGFYRVGILFDAMPPLDRLQVMSVTNLVN